MLLFGFILRYWSNFEVIARTILWSLSRTLWPLRYIHSLNGNWLFFSHFTYIVLSSINDSIWPNLTMWVTRWASYMNRNYLLFSSTCVGDIVAHLFSFVVLFLLCLSSSCALRTFIFNFTFSIIEYHFFPSCTVCEIILDDFVKHYVVWLLY